MSHFLKRLAQSPTQAGYFFTEHTSPQLPYSKNEPHLNSAYCGASGWCDYGLTLLREGFNVISVYASSLSSIVGILRTPLQHWLVNQALRPYIRA